MKMYGVQTAIAGTVYQQPAVAAYVECAGAVVCQCVDAEVYVFSQHCFEACLSCPA